MKRTRILAVPLRTTSRSSPSIEQQLSRPSEVAPGSISERQALAIQPRIPTSDLDGLIAVLDSPQQDRSRILRERARNYVAVPGQTAANCCAVYLLLADLLDQAWDTSVHRNTIFISPPQTTPTPGESVDDVKARLRASLQASRNAQLADPSVRAFIKRMEKPRFYRGQKVSVLDLVDDGHRLATQLREIAALPPSERLERLQEVVSPRVEVATANDICEHTGLPLLDVWRYFRHTWSLEYRPTPGRTLLLLVRNAAQPFSPVMGIAALANAVPQLNARDRWIGWTTADVRLLISQTPERWSALRSALLRTLDEARASIRADDLLTDAGAIDGRGLEHRLLALAGEAQSRRDRDLAERQNRAARGESLSSLRRLPTDAAGRTDWRLASQSPLFRRKRAQTLAEILFAIRLLSQSPDDGAGFARAMSSSKDLARALAIGMREIRKVGLASRLLELNVCGAIPPYGELLAGKLVALAVASREVSEWYEARYREQVSEIASQMAGREVVRSPVVCAISTTSLYGVAASQYNRLRVTVPTGDHQHQVKWDDLGHSTGFGTLHLSKETLKALRRVSVEAVGGRSVNNVFGEGTSPRLRQVRDALSRLGIEPSAILKHSARRRVYGLEVFAGGLESLLFNSTPPRRHLPSFAEIATSWTSRWLLNRITRREVLDRLSQVGPETISRVLNPAAERARNETPQRVAAKLRQPSAAPPRSPDWTVNMSLTPRPELVQGLYRASAACADHHDLETVQLLHIETPADLFVLNEAKKGKVVFVTGNPGDGKTHLLRRHASEFTAAGVTVCLDANERPDSELVELIQSSLHRKRGCAIAINQGILVDLLRYASEADWATTVREQLLRPFRYVGSRTHSASEASPAPERLVVVDLNLRNNLGRTIVESALARIIALSAQCATCGPDRCPGARNAARLAHPVPRQRVLELLDVVSRSGVHATMRDLQAFLAYLIFGGRVCAEGTTESDAVPYWTNAFCGGIGPLFDAVRRLDPAANPSPLLDDLLWRYADRKDDWATTNDDVPPHGEGLEARKASFLDRKRRALFEHRLGGGLLTTSGSHADRLFRSLVEGEANKTRSVVRLLNRFFDRDDEQDEILLLWVTHRYDAHSSRYAACAASVPTSMLEVAVPVLPLHLAAAFPDFWPDHVVLRRKGSPDSEGLKIDRAFLEALHAADQGLPTTFRRGEPEARIAAFYDRLAKVAWQEAPTESIKVKLVDIDTGRNLPLIVDVANRRYQQY